MKKHTWLMAIGTLLLGGALAMAEVGFAQAQGGPQRGGNVQCPGYGAGPGNANCPNYPGYQNRGRKGSNNRQRGTCPRWGATTPPAVPQGQQTPAPQSGG